MKNFALIGKHITYSKSPDIHRYMSRYLKMDFSYDLIDVDQTYLSILIKQLRMGNYHGFNVTQPYKEIMIDYVDDLTVQARKIGAINTIYLKDNRVIGDNTDYDGFKGLLERRRLKIEGRRFYILGTGGAAKACYHVLKDLKAHVTFVTRDALKVNEETITYKQIIKEDVDIFVQATPVGTYPHLQQSIIPKELVDNKYVIDLVYNPLETQILKFAKKGINGIDMLMIQALKSLSIWLEKDIELTLALHKALKEVIANE